MAALPANDRTSEGDPRDRQASVAVPARDDRYPSGTWEEAKPFLEAKYSDAYVFTIGFPEGLIDEMDRNAVLEWTAREPATRAALLAHVVAWNLADTSLAAELVDSYAHIEEVSQAFHSRRMSGAWVGAASEHWATLARELEEIVRSTKRSGLRKWASAMAIDLREREERDRTREQERDLRERD